jgi:hypothetical protein
MYVCTYVRMFVCMYVRRYACMHACMYVCMYVRMYECMYACMYVCMYTYTYVFMYKYLLAHPLSLVCSTWIPVSVCVCCIAQLMWLAIFGWKRLCRFARSYARLFSAAGIQPIGGFWGPKNTECWIYMLIISVGNHTLTQKLESKE